MNWKIIEPKADKLKNDLIQILGKLLAESRQGNVKKPDKLLEITKTVLENPEYNIIVCGEVKRGKSSFINSVIGQDLLPTGDRETTSQVFRISHSNEESYELNFKDGTKEPITREQLTYFGSQIDADLYGEPLFKNRRLDYIQINTNVEFLPKGVNIVDTPGLGALYKAHSEITNEFVTRADAVIFVLDPYQPLVQQEKEFLKKVFEITPYVLFIMTKIDTVEESVWINQIRRDEQLLKDSFEKESFATIQIFPISSRNLSKASGEENEALQELLIEDSFFPKVKEELMYMIFRAAGLSRNILAYKESVKYFNSAFPGIEEQLRITASENESEQAALKAEKEQVLSSFNTNWGPTSPKRKEMIQKVTEILNAAKSECYQLFDSSRPIYQRFLNEIDALSGIEEAKTYSKNLGESVASEINTMWNNITNSAQTQIAEIFYEYKTKISTSGHKEISVSEYNSTITGQDSHAGKTFQGMLKFALPGAGLFTIGTQILTWVGFALPFSAPVFLIGAVLFGLWKGNKISHEQELLEAKNKLKQHLAKIFNDCHHQMMEVSVMGNKYNSAIDAFTKELLISVENAMTELYESSKQQYTAEKERLEKQSQLKGSERRKELDSLNLQRKNWLSIMDNIKQANVALKEVEQALAGN